MKHKKQPNVAVPGEGEQIPVDENLPESIPAEEEAGGETNTPQEETAKLAAELQALKEKLMYLEADYQNYRKRVVKDLSEARLCGTAGTLEPFLTVFDFLGMAKNAAEKSDNIESIRQGLNMIIGVVPIGLLFFVLGGIVLSYFPYIGILLCRRWKKRGTLP